MALYIAGSINMDVVAFSKRLPLPGETLLGNRLGFFPGGKGLNAAIGAVRQGVDTRLIGRLGEDAFGRQLMSFARDEGLDLDHTVHLAQCSSGTAIIMVGEDGENSIVVIPGANGEVTPEVVLAPDYEEQDVLLAVFEIPLPTVKSFLERGRLQGSRTILSPAPAMACDFLDLPDFLVMNETELGFYGGKSQESWTVENAIEAAQALRSEGDQTVIVTLGADGCIAVTREEFLTVPGRSVHAIDCTGAGDCFAGSFAARLVAGDDLRSALEYATVAASISVTREGASPSMPTAEEVQDALF